MNAVDAFRFFNPMGERYELLEAGATKTQWIAMKFGMFFIVPEENAVSIDDLAERKRISCHTLLDSASHWPAID